ncbi:MAG: hypothetical protein Q8R60_13030 [Mycobacteriales bacterium]|nr:hypothetical protein [Mycobacteriales bacterium]
MSPTDDDADLRARLARLDPAPPSLPTVPFASPRAQELLERAMTSTTRTRRPALLAGAASLAVAAALGGVLLTQTDSGTSSSPTTLALDLAGGDGAIASCMMFDVAFLKDMSPAFAGTATEVTDDSVTVEVDRWYAGGDADQVVLSRPDGASSAALDGVAFEQGKRYLITAAQGTVNGCGYSGLATPDLEKSFDEAFPKG